MFKANNTYKKIKGWGPILLELFPFMILNGFCMCIFPKYLEESSLELHQTVQTHSYIQNKYLK